MGAYHAPSLHLIPILERPLLTKASRIRDIIDAGQLHTPNDFPAPNRHKFRLQSAEMKLPAAALGLAISIPLANAYTGDLTHYTPGVGT